MFDLADYTIDKSLRSSDRSELLLATRNRDGQQLLLKRYHRDRLPNGRSRARGEWKALSEIRSGDDAPAQIARALELIAASPAPVLVLEPIPGQSLHQLVTNERPGPEVVLRLARSLAAALAHVHTKRWIHLDINPENILVDAARGAAYLIDFGSARKLGGSSTDILSRTGTYSNGPAGGLAFSSPEQTGRMGRGVDFRSDLYALGATLFFALAGRPPFELDDPLALIHAHFARIPEALHSLDPRIPVAVSRLVAKLLEKDPDQRYQSAFALGQDLERCLTHLQESGNIPEDLPLGKGEATTRPIFRPKAFGRSEEVEQLRHTWAEVTSGAARVVFVSGPPGIGKTTLVDAIRPEVTRAQGSVVSGRCVGSEGDSVHRALREALTSLADQMLCCGDEAIEAWQTRLRAQLGNLAGVAVEFAPDLGSVIGEHPPVAPLRPREAATRLSLTLERLLRACATIEHPLVIRLDDAHQASGDGIELLQQLIGSLNEACVLWVMTFASDTDHGLATLRQRLDARSSKVERVEIALRPLDVSAIAELIADALAATPDQVAPLARAAARKTDRSPLSVQEFVLHLHSEAKLSPSASGWSWDPRGVEEAAVQPGALELLCTKLERLDDAMQSFVCFLACIEDPFDPATVAELRGEPEHQVEQALYQLTDEGLLVPSARGLSFAHGRVREAAIGQSSEEQRASIHYHTAMQILSKTPAAELGDRAVEVSLHLLQGANYLDDSQRSVARSVHLAAGMRALASGAVQFAATHLGAARRLIRDEDWEAEPNEIFSILYESTEAELLAGRPEEARTLVEALCDRPLAGLQRTLALAKRVRVLTALGDPTVIDVLLASLRELGVRWRKEPNRWLVAMHVRWMDWRLRGPLDETKFVPPASRDLSWARPMLILIEAGAAMLRSESQLVTKSILLSLDSTLRNGTFRSPAMSLAALAPARIELLGHWRGLARYCDAALYWANKSDDIFNLRAKSSLYSFSLTWLRPRRELIEPARDLIPKLLELGDLQISGAALMSYLNCAAFSGRPIPEVIEAMRESGGVDRWPALHAFFRCYAESYTTLAEHDSLGIDWEARTLDLERPLELAVMGSHVHWMLALCMFDQFSLLGSVLGRSDEAVMLRATTAYPEYQLVRGLLAAHRAHSEAGRPARRALKELRQVARWLRARAEHAPDCAPLAAMLDAAIGRLESSPGEALRRYARAQSLARDARMVHYEAWILEQRAHLLLELRRTAESIATLQQASRQYGVWGAKAKQHQLALRIEDLRHH